MAYPERASQTTTTSLLWAPVSAGELLDKLTILDLKGSRLSEPSAIANAARERALLAKIGEEAGLLRDPRVAPLLHELRAVNATLWEVEDALRGHERRGAFDTAFVALARSVYLHNDRRSALKRAINEAVGSLLREEKSYGEAAAAVP